MLSRVALPPKNSTALIYSHKAEQVTPPHLRSKDSKDSHERPTLISFAVFRVHICALSSGPSFLATFFCHLFAFFSAFVGFDLPGLFGKGLRAGAVAGARTVAVAGTQLP